jgi:glycosyltransferase involved in cell wall biosynthesis
MEKVMATLSVVLATYNEEKNLASCLDSIKGLADEIVVIDGSSTDKTVEVAKKYEAKVIVTSNKPLFHINKQMAIDSATKDWILQLDADERLAPELAKEINETIKQWDNETMGYWIPRKNWFLGRFLTKGGQYPDYTLRLYRRGKGRLPCKSVHEQTVVEGEVGYLKNPLIHMADTSFRRYLMRWDRYTDLMARELREASSQKIAVARFCEALNHIFIKPAYWFILTYIRHKGFMDSWQGFVFSLFSSLRFPAAYIKYLKK